jgi:hypothetical protein
VRSISSRNSRWLIAQHFFSKLALADVYVLPQLVVAALHIFSQLLVAALHMFPQQIDTLLYSAQFLLDVAHTQP